MLSVEVPVLASHPCPCCDLDPAIRLGLDFGSSSTGSSSPPSSFASLPVSEACPCVRKLRVVFSSCCTFGLGSSPVGMCSWQSGIRVLISTAVLQ